MTTRKYMIAGPPVQLPTTDKEWDKARKVERKQSPSDVAEHVIRAIAKEKNGEFTDLLTRRDNKESIHGLTVIDQTMAAQIVVERTKKMGLETFSGEKGLGLAYKAINSVMGRRYGMSRRQLRAQSLVLISDVGHVGETANEAPPPADDSTSAA